VQKHGVALVPYQPFVREGEEVPEGALHKKYPLRMLFVRKTGLFGLEKPSKRDQKDLIDRLVRLLTGLFVQSRQRAQWR
jgi:hypothetical protein